MMETLAVPVWGAWMWKVRGTDSPAVYFLTLLENSQRLDVGGN